MGILGSVLGGVASAAAGGLFGGGKSKAKQATTKQPAPWEKDMRQLWDSFIDEVYGTGMDKVRREWAQKYVEARPDIEKWYNMKDRTESLEEFAMTHYEKWGKDEGMDERMGGPPPEAVPFQEKIKEDVEFRQAEIGEYEEALKGKEGGFLEAIDRYKTGISGAEEEYLKPATLGVGGVPVSMIPAPAARSYAAATKPAASMLGAEQLGYQTSTQNLDKLLALMPQMAPNVADREYMDWLLPIAQQMQALRYGVPSQETTAQYQPSLMGQLGTAVQAYPEMKQMGEDILKAIGGRWG